jgi:hypothetical protein
LENRKKLLGGVSAAAVAAGLGIAAVAGVTAGQPPERSQVAEAAPRAADALVELMLRAGDPPTAAAMTHAVRAMYGQLTLEQVDGLPTLIRGLRGLGLGGEIEAAATDTLLELVAASGLSLDDGQLEALAVALSARPDEYQVAGISGLPPGAGKASDKGKEKGRGKGLGLYSG